MRLFFVDEHERASESLDRIELMSLDGDRHGRFVARWVARRIEERLSEEERQALREAAEPELRLWSLAGIWPATRRCQPDLEPRGGAGLAPCGRGRGGGRCPDLSAGPDPGRRGLCGRHARV